MSALSKHFFALLLSIFFWQSCFAVDYPPLKTSTASYFANAWYYVFMPFNFVLPHPVIYKNIYEVQTKYNHIRVYEDESECKYLVFLPENGYQSVFDPKNPGTLISDYAKFTFLALAGLKKTPEKVLFVGMGGAVMPMYFRNHYPGIHIDIVELDDDIPSIAQEYFGFKPDKEMQVILGDGRKYIDETNEKYDIIFLDVYDAETIPVQFTTKEFFHNVRRCLTEDGILSVNLANLGESFVSRITSAITSEFPNTYIFLSERKTNYIIISVKNEKLTFSDLEKQGIALDGRKNFNIKFSEMLTNKVDKSL